METLLWPFSPSASVLGIILYCATLWLAVALMLFLAVRFLEGYNSKFTDWLGKGNSDDRVFTILHIWLWPLAITLWPLALIVVAVVLGIRFLGDKSNLFGGRAKQIRLRHKAAKADSAMAEFYAKQKKIK